MSNEWEKFLAKYYDDKKTLEQLNKEVEGMLKLPEIRLFDETQQALNSLKNKIKVQEDNMWFEKMKRCDHILIHSCEHNYDYEGRKTYFDFCVICGLTDKNQECDYIPYIRDTINLFKTQLEAGKLGPSFLTDQCLNYEYAINLYKKAQEIANINDSVILKHVMRSLLLCNKAVQVDKQKKL